MSQPDSVSSVDSFSYAVPASVIIFFIAFMMFQWENSSYFSVLLYFVIPLIVYLITGLFTFLAQYSACSTFRVGDVFYNSLISLVFTWIALGVSYFSWPRLPIASMVSPLFVGKSVDVVPSPNPAECCSPPLSLEKLEADAPMVKGFSYGFYLFFSTLFGLLVSIGFSSSC